MSLFRLREGGSSFFEQLKNYRDATDEIIAQWISDESNYQNTKDWKATAIKDLYSYRENADSGNFSCNESIRYD